MLNAALNTPAILNDTSGTETLADLPAAVRQAVTPIFAQQGDLTESSGATDGFGSAVAVSGGTIVVGAPGNNSLTGAAYVFTQSGFNWIEVAKLTGSDDNADESFGLAVGISGNTIVVGDPGATVGSNAMQGAAYVFTEPAGGWTNMTQTAKLTAADGAAGDEFGNQDEVGISGNTIVIGALFAKIGGNAGQGAAYVFSAPVSGWAGNLTQTAKLTAADGAAGDYFGVSVAISGNTVAVQSEAPVGTARGAVYVFTEHGSGWANMTQTAELTSSDETQNGGLGAVAISGNTIAAGGHGAAYLFTEPAAGWADMTQTAKFTASDATPDFGTSVSISGDTVVIGDWEVPTFHMPIIGGPGTVQPLQPGIVVSGGSGLPSAIYIFTKPAASWADTTETIKVTDPDAAGNDEFGRYVSIGGSTIVVGEGPGLVYVYGSYDIAVIPPGSQTATVGQSQLFTLGSLVTQSSAPGPFTVDVNWGDGSPDSTFSVAAPGTIPMESHTYANRGYDTVTITVTDSVGNVSNRPTFVVSVASAVPVFSNLTASSTITQGTPAVAFSGTISADNGTLIPPGGEVVVITLAGATYDAPINAQGFFEAAANTSQLPVSSTPYQVTYSYAGDASFTSVTDTTTTTVTVNSAVEPVYRLYSPVTKEHLFTADVNEYNTLAARGWVQEQIAWNWYAGPAIIAGATAEPIYRLYNTSDMRHVLTTDAVEYHTLKSLGGVWSAEGIAGYLFATAVASSRPLYSLNYPKLGNLFLLTADANEFATLTDGVGWVSEGVVGYVM